MSASAAYHYHPKYFSCCNICKTSILGRRKGPTDRKPHTADTVSVSFKSQLLHFWKTRKSPPPLICLHKPPPLSQCLSEMATICSSSLCWQPQVRNLTSPAWCCTATAQGWGTDSSFERFARVQVTGNNKLTSAPTAPRQGTPSTWLTLFL